MSTLDLIHSIVIGPDNARVEADIPDNHGLTEIWPGTQNMQSQIEDSDNDGSPDQLLLWDTVHSRLCDTELKVCIDSDSFEISEYSKEQAEFAEKIFAEGLRYAQGRLKTFLDANLLFSPRQISTSFTAEGWSYQFPFLTATLGLLDYYSNFRELIENFPDDSVGKPVIPTIDCIQNAGCYLDIPRGFGPGGQFIPALRVYLDPMAKSEMNAFFDASSKKEVVASTTFSEGGVSLQFRILPAAN